MLRVYTEIIIEASAEEIWTNLLNFAEYDRWNPYIKSIEGNAKKDEFLIVQFPTVKMKTKVNDIIEKHMLSWKGKMVINGLLDSIHVFRITKISENCCLFEQYETFKGIMTSFLARKIKTSAQADFTKMNTALKRKCENR
ncbi:MAG: SRPBCC domain-containing protein [Sphingobacterium sp.]|jgi:hypothetical protein|nr:SRPBCC domain-containing protein [Sphingobacterium sp.]